MGVTAAILETLSGIGDPYSAGLRAGAHGLFTVPIGIAFFFGSQMGGIYNVPPKHRGRP